MSDKTERYPIPNRDPDIILERTLDYPKVEIWSSEDLCNIGGSDSTVKIADCRMSTYGPKFGTTDEMIKAVIENEDVPQQWKDACMSFAVLREIL